MDYGPLNGHKSPKLLNFIYTVPTYRRQGYASKLLDFAKTTNIRFTAFCLNKSFEKLFKKQDYLFWGCFTGSVMYRAANDI